MKSNSSRNSYPLNDQAHRRVQVLGQHFTLSLSHQLFACQLISLIKYQLKFNSYYIMLKIENKILTNQNRYLSLQLGFANLKLNMSDMPSSSIESPNIKNKALYLNYVDEVLQNKEADLLKFEKQLQIKENYLTQIQFKKGIGIMIDQMESLKLMEKKLRCIQQKMGIRDQQYMALYRKFEKDCSNCKDEMQEAFKKQYADLVNERRLLRNKITQFSELQSYEKYLNDLHSALQLKSQQLIQRQSLFSQNSHNSQQFPNPEKKVPDHEQFDSHRYTQQSNSSNRKRIKIFNTKPHHCQQSKHSSGFNQVFFDQNHTFAKENTSSDQIHDSGLLNQNHQQYFNIHDSSAILGEDSKDIQYYQKMDASKQSKQQIFAYKVDNKQDSIEYPKYQCQKSEISIQTDYETIDQADKRLRQQSLIAKYLKKWLRFSLDVQKNLPAKKRVAALYLWRMNVNLDEKIRIQAIKSVQVYQKLWNKKQNILAQSKMFPYNELSIKRKKYAELMFDLEKKIFHRLKVEDLLKSILKNKHRKQRLIFYLYFCKLIKNTSLPFQSQTDQNKVNKMSAELLTVANPHSDYKSTLSSQVLSEQKINIPVKKMSPAMTNSKSQLISKQPSLKKINSSSHCQARGKQNKGSVEVKKLEEELQMMRETINDKERIQKLLATQCVKLEGLIKMGITLTQATFRTKNWAVKRMVQDEFQERVENLTSHLNGLQFKFQLVMAKCKLGLANNSNKLSTLQSLLDFSNLIK